MKSRLSFPGTILFLVVFQLCYTLNSTAQSKVLLDFGLSVPEFIYAGAGFESGNLCADAGVGSFPSTDKVLSFSGSISYHFAGHTVYNVRKPYYARAGIDYLYDDSKNYTDHSTFLDFRLGRDFNFSDRTGIRFDLGMVYLIIHHEVEKQTSPWAFNFNFRFLPVAGLCLFYRF